MSQKREAASTDVSILSSGVRVEGKFYSDGNVRVDGKITGEVIVNGNLTLGDSSEILGDSKAKNITVSGKIDGTVNASEKLILESRAKVKGDLIAKVLVIEEGAIFDGSSSMSKKSVEAPAVQVSSEN